MTAQRTALAMLTIGVAALIFLAWVLVSFGSSIQAPPFWLEVEKGLIQVVVIVVLGTMVKMLADSYQASRQRAEALEELRKDTYARLVTVTSSLRAARIFIVANGSVKTWNEQMEHVLTADATLRQIKHEIDSSGRIGEPLFPDWKRIVEHLHNMYEYTSWIAADFAATNQELSDEQHAAERPRQAVGDQLERQPALSDKLMKFKSARDMAASIDVAPTDQSWTSYELNEGNVLGLMLHRSGRARE